jgi:hypothetical protein
MTCQGYYEDPRHLDPGGPDRCENRDIEASSARSVAILGFSTTAFGVLNLFISKAPCYNRTAINLDPSKRSY